MCKQQKSQSYLTCMLTLICVMTVFFNSTYAQGQSPKNLFKYMPAGDSTAFSNQQSERLDAYRADPTSADVRVVNLQMGVLKSLDSVNVNFSEEQSLALDIVRMEERSASDYSWFGNSSSTQEQAVLVVQDNEVYGTLRSAGQLFRVRPLDGGLHALIRVDETKFPPEHPPEFESMEKDTRQIMSEQVPDSFDTGDACSEYNAIIAYTSGAKAQVGNIDALIQLAIDETNQGYANSGVNTKIKLAHKYQTNYTESANMATDRDRFRIKNDGIMDEVHSKRDQYAADVALLMTKSGNYCGIASAIGATEETAFAVVGQNCATGYYSFAHEIGHLQSARHNTQADPTNTPYAYGHGYYYQPAKWRTIMSYACPGGCTRLNYWSNPNVKKDGIAMGTAATNNNARVLNNTACKVANFRKSTTTGGATGPLAFGVVLSNGTKYSGTSNWTSSYNSTYKRYEIKISGHQYYYLKYATNVTPAGDIRFCRSSSVSGKLLVYCSDKNGNPASSRFGFTTFKSP